MLLNQNFLRIARKRMCCVRADAALFQAALLVKSDPAYRTIDAMKMDLNQEGIPHG